MDNFCYIFAVVFAGDAEAEYIALCHYNGNELICCIFTVGILVCVITAHVLFAVFVQKCICGLACRVAATSVDAVGPLSWRYLWSIVSHYAVWFFDHIMSCLIFEFVAEYHTVGFPVHICWWSFKLLCLRIVSLLFSASSSQVSTGKYSIITQPV